MRRQFWRGTSGSFAHNWQSRGAKHCHCMSSKVVPFSTNWLSHAIMIRTTRKTILAPHKEVLVHVLLIWIVFSSLYVYDILLQKLQTFQKHRYLSKWWKSHVCLKVVVFILVPCEKIGQIHLSFRQRRVYTVDQSIIGPHWGTNNHFLIPTIVLFWDCGNLLREKTSDIRRQCKPCTVRPW